MGCWHGRERAFYDVVRSVNNRHRAFAPCCKSGFTAEYIEKDVEIRVTLVGESVFAAELHSQAHEDAVVDWRKGDVFAIEHRIHELPAAVQRQCIDLQAYGLQFGAIDLIRRKDETYIFLELNPNVNMGG